MSTDSALDESTPRCLGKYELQERLGQGEIAEVWKALDTQLQRPVALKLLHADLQNDADFLTRFLREIRVMASLHHPNIAQIYDFQVSRPPVGAMASPDPHNTPAYMVMEYIDGQTLANFLAQTSQRGNVPAPEAIVGLFSAIGRALDYAHARGMIHGDLKPTNILLDQRNMLQNSMGEPVLTDFGLVTLLDSSTPTRRGLNPYNAPEQAQGIVNQRSDIYSLGVILYEMCTGKLPFPGHTATAFLKQRTPPAPTPPEQLDPNISPALSEVILHCLSREPEARFASASAFVAALARALHISMQGWHVQEVSSQVQSPEPGGISPPSWPGIGVLSSPGTLSTPTFGTPGLQTPVHSSGAGPLSGQSSRTPIGASSSPSTAQFGQGSPITLVPLTTPATSPRQSVPTLPPISVPGSPPLLSSGEAAQRRKWRGWFLAFIALLVVLLAGSGLGTLFLLTYLGNGTPADNTPGGHAYFLSSGLLNEGSSQGINDELQIELRNMSDTVSGTHYYAWLLSDRTASSTKFLLLGRLPVQQGSVQFTYPGDAKHTNLIAQYSRLLITEEFGQGGSFPTHPSTDMSTWRYYAELPQIPARIGRQHHSALDFLRDLLYEGSTLQKFGIHGGVNARMLLNTQKVLEWVSSARDSWPARDAKFIHRQVVRTLDYLDGKTLVQLDVPAGTPLLVNSSLISVPLLDMVQGKQVFGYINRMHTRLQGILSSPGISSEIRRLAIQSDRAVLENVQAALEQVHTDAAQLVRMNDLQLSQPAALALLNNMQTQANYAFVGRLDPSTNGVRAGVVQIYYTIQQLATFQVRTFHS